MIANREYPAQIAASLKEGGLHLHWGALVAAIAESFPGSTWDELVLAIKIVTEITRTDVNEEVERGVDEYLRRYDAGELDEGGTA